MAKFQIIYVAMLLLSLCFINVTIADESFLFKQNEVNYIELKMLNYNLSSCYDCSCKITIFYPDGSTMVKNANGTTEQDYCVYNLTPDVLGKYGGEFHITNNVDYGGGVFEFEVTRSGTKNNQIFNLAVFSVVVGIWLIFTYLMHKWKEDEGASVAYGTLATVFIVIMGGLILSGFEVILTNLTLLININYYISAICFGMALYSGAYSYFLWESVRHRRMEYEAR